MLSCALEEEPGQEQMKRLPVSAMRILGFLNLVPLGPHRMPCYSLTWTLDVGRGQRLGMIDKANKSTERVISWTCGRGELETRGSVTSWPGLRPFLSLSWLCSSLGFPGGLQALSVVPGLL